MNQTTAAVQVNKAGLIRELGLRDGIAIVAGTVIGSGTFLVPTSVASQTLFFF
jgi:hypothetical protein